MTKPQSKHFTVLLLLLFLSVFLTACFDDDDDHVDQAIIVPAVNPDFDSITSVEKADTADDVINDNFTALTLTTDYTVGDHGKITLAASQVGASGTYFRITGKATMHGASNDYTVYTFAEDNAVNRAANELTTLAIAAIVNGDITDADIDADSLTIWDAAINHLIEETGLSYNDITMGMTEEDRDGMVNLQASLSELAMHVMGTDPSLTDFASNAAVPNMDKIAWGALLYDNWMTAPATAPEATSGDADPHAGHHKPSARAGEHDAHTGATGNQNHEPTKLMVMLTDGTTARNVETHHDAEHSGFRRFARCGECHGWDQMGSNGSFESRGRSTTMLRDPNDETDSASFKKRPLAIDDTDLVTGRTGIFEAFDIVKSDSVGNTYAGISTAITATTVEDDGATDGLATKWNDAITATSDMHPDFTRTAAADATNSTNTHEGEVNDIVPSKHEVMALAAFLNYNGGKAGHVMSYTKSSDAAAVYGSYTLDEDADAQHGEMRYMNYCFRCHGAADTTDGNILSHDYGNMVGYLTTEDKAGTADSEVLNPMRLSRVFHIARWGKSGKVMSRDRIGYPTAHDVSNMLAYLTELRASTFVSTNMASMITAAQGTAAAGETLYYSNCAGCHAASASTLTASAESSTEGEGEDTTFRCHVVATDGTESVEAATDGSCGTNHAIPNLGHAMSHTMMTSDLSKVSAVMGNVTELTQQNINDLAAFFRSLSAQ